MTAGRQTTLTDAQRIEGLTYLCERIIEVHAHVVMDTPEDRDLHDRAVATFRESLSRLSPPARETTPARGRYPLLEDELWNS